MNGRPRRIPLGVEVACYDRDPALRALISARALAAGQALADGYDVTRPWVPAGDGKVRLQHADAEGQSVGLDEPYDVGGEDLMYPGDPSASEAMTAGCRCGEDYEVS